MEAVMTLPVFIRPEAERDIADAQAWYERQRQGLGNESLLGVEEARDRISSTPNMYAIVYRGLRACPISKFSYILYYKVEARQIEVAAVAHSRRDASAWKSRA